MNMAASGCRFSNRVLQRSRKEFLYSATHQIKLQNVWRRTVLSAAEPRRRLPVQMYAIKKDMRRMQHKMEYADFKVHQFPLLQVGFFVLGITLTISFLALDPDQLADAQVEIAMYGYGGFLQHLLDPEYDIGQGLHDDDDEDEYVDDDEEEDHELYEYYYEDEEKK